MAAYGTDPVAPRALLALQVYGDGMKDVESAERLYREAIKRFPNTPAAHFATGKLDRL